MYEIDEFLIYDCSILKVTTSWEDSYWTPIKQEESISAKCFIDSPKAWQDYDWTWLKIDAILFLNPSVDIISWYEVRNISKDWLVIDSKRYKVISIEKLLDDNWLHHLEANLQILW